DLFNVLHELHLRAGEPSMREIARMSGKLSHDTAHRVLTQPHCPPWRPLEEVVIALRGDEQRLFSLWMAARLAEDNSERQLETTTSPSVPAPGASVAAFEPATP